VIHADFGGYRLFSVARLLEISLQRAQQRVRANHIFFCQLIPPLPAAQKYTPLRDHIESVSHPKARTEKIVARREYRRQQAAALDTRIESWGTNIVIRIINLRQLALRVPSRAPTTIGSPSASNLFSPSPVATFPTALTARKIDCSAPSIEPDKATVHSILIRLPSRSEMIGSMTFPANRKPCQFVNLNG
jgi:hypothetical protein